jgi:hypothetical protein
MLDVVLVYQDGTRESIVVGMHRVTGALLALTINETREVLVPLANIRMYIVTVRAAVPVAPTPPVPDKYVPQPERFPGAATDNEVG